MEAMKNVFLNAINGGNFNLSEMETKIDTLWVKGSLTEAERNELLELAAAKANDLNQIDVVARIAELERRVYALENPPEEEQGEPEVVYPVWESKYITSKGETVQFDYDNDGTLDLLQFTIFINGIFGEHAGQLDVQTALTYGKRYLILL